jgi:hypothetical protein
MDDKGLDFRPSSFAMRDVLFDRLGRVLATHREKHSLLRTLRGLDDLALKLVVREKLTEAQLRDLQGYVDAARFELHEPKPFHDATREAVEIAIVTWCLLSPCGDSISIQAKVKDGAYRYRIVGEEGTRFRIRYPRLPQPLSMRQLVRMMDEAIQCDDDGSPMDEETLHFKMFESNLAADLSREECSFPDVLSVFYPGLEAHYEAEGEAFLDENCRD